MSAELLREAADAMRGEYETDPFRLGRTMRAAADWLDYTANYAAWCERQHPDAVEADGLITYGTDLARAYLGRDA